MAFKIFYINLQGLLCFVLWRACISQKETINYFSSFYLHKCLVKIVYKLMKLIRDQVKTIDAGSMFRRWGAISMNSQDSLVLRDHPPTPNHWNFETFWNSYDVMKPRLLKSRDFGSLIRTPNHCFETNDSQKFRSFTKQCFEGAHH